MVGIGIATPTQKLDVKDGFIQVSGSGPSGYGYLLNRAGQDIYSIRHLDGGLTIQNETDSNRKEMTFGGNGNVGIGATSPTAKLHVSGSIWASGSSGHITASGDISASGYIYGKLRRTVESKTSDYTLVASDAGKVILMDVGGVDIIISASVFTAGDEFTIINNSGSPSPCLVKTGPLTTMFVVGTAYLNTDFTLAARRGIKFICEVGGSAPRFYGWRS
jgi:hypothetical protein